MPVDYQEENKILDKMDRQKVAEVEKLTQTVHELEEAVLASGAAANAVRDYRRKVQEMNVINISWNSSSCKSLCSCSESVTNANCL
ncbi:microtubule-associated protein 70-2-like [Prunus yedoensis var. nudiflora]|uniref:Microtubule-associated protein 70-2-like n=1 Tax=Prunus yedoensis var. nudiflora TaxID=2094558 RepID=A0A314UXN4_PRUYE|nr:microtubule-associated protein 70-2-like [Prunus yedoensis var. nudiflora]